MLNSDLTQLVVIDSITHNATISASSNYTANITVSKDGYTPIGVVGWTVASYALTIIRARISGSGLSLWIRNTTQNDDQTVEMIFDVLYKRN